MVTAYPAAWLSDIFEIAVLAVVDVSASVPVVVAVAATAFIVGVVLGSCSSYRTSSNVIRVRVIDHCQTMLLSTHLLSTLSLAHYPKHLTISTLS